jgi:hypothetical protein
MVYAALTNNDTDSYYFSCNIKSKISLVLVYTLYTNVFIPDCRQKQLVRPFNTLRKLISTSVPDPVMEAYCSCSSEVSFLSL